MTPFTYRISFVIFWVGLFPMGLSAQSLIEDAAKLVEAKRLLAQQTDTLDADTIQMALADAMAILQQYDAAVPDDTPAELLKTAEHYQSNQVLADWLPLRQLKQYAEAPDSASMAWYRAKRTLL
ncbi:MAG: hypothetical protein HRU12_10870, partial [Phaeodactylibacter sp.]|nr:hypothetical protein [Phaeodactylibacter sp.]